MAFFREGFSIKIPERLETDRLAEQKTYKGAEELFSMIIDRYGKENQIFVMAVIRKSDDQYVGAIGLMPVEGSTDVEVFYTLLPKYWGKGYATEATHRLFAYVFSESDVQRIVASIFPANEASEKVAERVGMAYKGFVMRKLQGGRVKLYTLSREHFFSR